MSPRQRHARRRNDRDSIMPRQRIVSRLRSRKNPDCSRSQSHQPRPAKKRPDRVVVAKTEPVTTSKTQSIERWPPSNNLVNVSQNLRVGDLTSDNGGFEFSGWTLGNPRGSNECFDDHPQDPLTHFDPKLFGNPFEDRPVSNEMKARSRQESPFSPPTLSWESSTLVQESSQYSSSSGTGSASSVFSDDGEPHSVVSEVRLWEPVDEPEVSLRDSLVNDVSWLPFPDMAHELAVARFPGIHDVELSQEELPDHGNDCSMSQQMGFEPLTGFQDVETGASLPVFKYESPPALAPVQMLDACQHTTALASCMSCESVPLGISCDRSPEPYSPWPNGVDQIEELSKLSSIIKCDEEQLCNDLNIEYDSEEDESFTDVGDGKKRPWACPFYRRDCIKYMTCLTLKLTRVKDVKQHIYRRHRGETLNCSCCDMSEEKVQELKKRATKSGSEYQTWFSVWDTLFPCSRLSGPSPYLKSNIMQEMADVSKRYYELNSQDAILGYLRKRFAKAIPSSEEHLARMFQEILKTLQAQFQQTLKLYSLS